MTSLRKCLWAALAVVAAGMVAGEAQAGCHRGGGGFRGGCHFGGGHHYSPPVYVQPRPVYYPPPQPVIVEQPVIQPNPIPQPPPPPPRTQPKPPVPPPAAAPQSAGVGDALLQSIRQLDGTADGDLANVQVGRTFFEMAAESFRNNNLPAAAQQIAHAALELPNDADVRQLRALILSVQGDYAGAMAVLGPGLAAGELWDADRLGSFYASPEAYAEQFQSLRKFAAANPEAADAHLALAWHEMMLGRRDAARQQIQVVMQQAPESQPARQLLQVVQQLPADNAPAQPPATGPAAVNPAPAAPNAAPPSGPGPSGGVPAREPIGGTLAETNQQQQPAVVGDWTARLSNGAVVQLTLAADGAFRWLATTNGRTSTFAGRYSLQGDQLTLSRSNDNQNLAGTLTFTGGNSFTFRLNNTQNQEPLTFTR